MRIINIVDNISKVNFGIWNAALSTANFHVTVHKNIVDIWFPKTSTPPELEDYIQQRSLDDLSISQLKSILKTENFDLSNTIFITHGTWNYPSKWGHYLKKIGYKWIYVPHGMLEPWSMAQKALKKNLYFRFFEKKYAISSDVIRAVGKPEMNNLKKKLPNSNVRLIPNGVDKHSHGKCFGKEENLRVLFLGRLHHKKCITELVKAWSKSTLRNSGKYELVIAGPDQGELEKINEIITTTECANINYIGSVYGNDKIKILESCSFFALPSHSEGFPTSIVEAISYGLIPLYSDGCNFPELTEHNIGYLVHPNVPSIQKALEAINQAEKETHVIMSKKAMDLYATAYTTEKVAEQENNLYQSVLRVI